MRACDSLCVYYYNLTFLRFHFSLHLIVLSLIVKIKWTNKRALTAHNAVYIVFRLPNFRHLINEFSVNWITRKRTHAPNILAWKSHIFNLLFVVRESQEKSTHVYVLQPNRAKGIFERKFNLQTEFHFHNKRTGVLCMARKSNEKNLTQSFALCVDISMCSSLVECLRVCLTANFWIVFYILYRSPQKQFSRRYFEF